MREARSELERKCKLAGDSQYPESIVSAFKEYVSSYKKFADKSKSAKPLKELSALGVMLSRVEARCAAGDMGCVASIYNFLTDEASSRRTQAAFKFMKVPNAVQNAAPVVPMALMGPRPSGPMFRGRGGPPRFRGGFREQSQRCYSCRNYGHFARACPMNR